MARTTINSLAVSTGKGLWPPEFMTLFVFMFEWSHKSHFSILFFKFLKNGPPFGKKIKNFPNTNFFSKSYTSSFWICILHVLSIFLKYVTLMYLKIPNLIIFLHEKFHYLPPSFESQFGQNYSSWRAAFGVYGQAKIK